MQPNTKYYLGFSHFLGIGPMRFKALMQYFGDIKKAYEADESSISYIIGPYYSNSFVQFRNKFNAEEKIEELRKKQITIITQADERFPQSLKTIADSPICLYVKGDVNNFSFTKDFFIGIVGTRRPTSYGEQITKKFTYELANAGFVIVSGMALGIDTTAQETALDAKERTIAVLGCGVDIIYPPSNRRLYERIIKNRGLIISEFPPGRTVVKGMFISRNRLVSGLSRGVVVIEGVSDSGALITARYAAEQGREVFAPPGPLTSNMSAAPNLLLKQGAKFATSVEDILEEFNLKIIPKKLDSTRLNLTQDEKLIFNLLLNEPHSADEMVEKIKLSINEIFNLLSGLEIRRIVERNSEGKYQINNLN